MSVAGGRRTFFATPLDFRRWLAKSHAREAELWVGFHKRGSGKPSVTWPESVDEALCYGWIDGLRRSIDATSYEIRFTPRKKGSHWSHVNVARVAELTKLRRMKKAGLAAFAARDPARTGHAAYEQKKETVALTPEDLRAFSAARGALAYWEARPPWYRHTATWWVLRAKQPATRARRLAALIAACAAGEPIGPLRRTPTRT